MSLNQSFLFPFLQPLWYSNINFIIYRTLKLLIDHIHWFQTIFKDYFKSSVSVFTAKKETFITQDPHPVLRLKRREGRRPAILLGLRDNENDSGVIKVWSRKLQVSPSSLTIPVSGSITTEQVWLGSFQALPNTWIRTEKKLKFANLQGEPKTRIFL